MHPKYIKEVLDENKFGCIISIKKLKGGFVKETYKVSTQKENAINFCIVCFFPSDYDETFESNLNCQRRIAYHGLPIPTPLTQFGKFGSVVYSFVEGIHVSGEKREEWQIAQISQFLGKLHKLSLDGIFDDLYDENIIETTKYIEFPRQFKSYHKYIKSYFEFDHEFASMIETVCFSLASFFEKEENRAMMDRLPNGFIHTDLHEDNVLFHNSIISGVLDWDDASYGVLILDLAMTLSFWSINSNRKEKIEAENDSTTTFDLEICRSFIDSYSKAREKELTIEESKVLYYFILFAGFIQMNFVMKYCIKEQKILEDRKPNQKNEIPSDILLNNDSNESEGESDDDYQSLRELVREQHICLVNLVALGESDFVQKTTLTK